jgi:DNA topoisomerase-3
VKELKKGQEILVNNFETKESETSPPTRYNSGSIILAMENAGKLIEEEELREQIKGAGIGTSATRAEIIKKLEKIKYIQINTKTQIITPTKKGETIYDVVYSSMQDLLNPKLTASWEKGLDMVAKKQIKSNEFMVKLESYIKGKIDKLVIHM